MGESTGSGIGYVVLVGMLAFFFVGLVMVISLAKKEKKRREEEQRKMERFAETTPSSGVKKATTPARPSVVQRRDSLSNVMGGAAPSIDFHTHPSQMAKPSVRMELAYVEDSAGGEITEGCPEHYSYRIVGLDEEEYSPHSAIEDLLALDGENGQTELLKTMVIGDVLNNPKYRHR